MKQNREPETLKNLLHTEQLKKEWLEVATEGEGDTYFITKVIWRLNFNWIWT